MSPLTSKSHKKHANPFLSSNKHVKKSKAKPSWRLWQSLCWSCTCYEDRRWKGLKTTSTGGPDSHCVDPSFTCYDDDR